jgi:hypothetical protein
MNTPDQTTTPPKKSSGLKRVAQILWIFAGIVLVMGVIGSVFGPKKKDAATTEATSGPTPAPEAGAGQPQTGTSAKTMSGMTMEAMMDRLQAHAGGGEWEQKSDHNYELLLPGRSRNFKTAKVSGIHKLVVYKVRGPEARMSVSIQVYLDQAKRDVSGNYVEYASIADWIANVTAWSGNTPIDESVKATAVRYMAKHLPTAFETPGTAPLDPLSIANRISFRFLTGGTASVGLPVKWLHVGTEVSLADGASPTGASTPPTLDDQIMAAKALVDRWQQIGDQQIADLRARLDRAGEGPQTTGEVLFMARQIREGNEHMAFHALERTTNYRVTMYRRNLIDLRDGQRHVVAAMKDLAGLEKEAYRKRRAEQDEQRRLASVAVGVRVPRPSSSALP